MGLIRSEDPAGDRVRGLELGLPVSPNPSPLEMELDQARTEIAQLRGALARAQAAQEALALAQADALSAARAEARSQGETEGRRAASRSDEILRAGLEEAATRIAGDLAGLEGLAIELAREGLGRILEDPTQQAVLVGQALRRQFRELQSSSVLEVEVSRLDFPSEADLRRLAESLARSDLGLSAAADLPAGGCRMRLGLGGLDIGIGRQWGQLKALLERLAEDGEGAA